MARICQYAEAKHEPQPWHLDVGAGGETRTLMSVTSPDFESGAYTNFATPAQCGLDSQAILVAAATPRQLLWPWVLVHPCSIEKQVESSKKSARIHPKRLFANAQVLLYNCQAGLDRRLNILQGRPPRFPQTVTVR